RHGREPRAPLAVNPMDPRSSEELTTRVDQVLRALPLRRAPASLEDRVQRAIAARGVRPWWRAAYGHWPQPARIGFWMASLALVGGLAAAGLSLGGVAWGEALWVAPLEWGAAWQVAAGTLSSVVGRWL